MRRAAVALLFAVISGVVIGLAPMTAPAGAVPCQAGAQRVAVVVDFGDGVTVTSTCVGLADRATGYDALTARAAALGTAAPRVENGLVCAIDGYPEAGCAQQNADGTYSYWSYWKGSASWTYSSVGASSRARPDVVEGWRFLTKSREEAAPPPNGSPSASSTCVAAPADTTPAGDDLTTVPPADVGAAPNSTPTSVEATTPPPASDPTSTTTSTTTTAPGSSASSSSGAVAAPVVTVSAQDDRGRGGGSPVGLIAGIAVVGGLGVGGAMLVRRRGPIS